MRNVMLHATAAQLCADSLSHRLCTAVLHHACMHTYTCTHNFHGVRTMWVCDTPQVAPPLCNLAVACNGLRSIYARCVVCMTHTWFCCNPVVSLTNWVLSLTLTCVRLTNQQRACQHVAPKYQVLGQHGNGGVCCRLGTITIYYLAADSNSAKPASLCAITVVLSSLDKGCVRGQYSRLSVFHNSSFPLLMSAGM
jgi:hypothetical protein